MILAATSAATIGIISGTSIVKAEESEVVSEIIEQSTETAEIIQEPTENLEVVSSDTDSVVQQDNAVSTELVQSEDVVQNEQVNQILQDGWELQSDGNYKYVQNGKYLVNEWLSFKGNYYYFDWNCLMVKDFFGYQIGDSIYGFDENGCMITGLYTNQYGATYYYSESGVAQAGPVTVNGNRYFSNESGLILQSTTEVFNNVLYRIDENGIIVEEIFINYNGWTKIDNDWYYYDELGNPYIGWKNIDGFYYYFDYNGKAYRNGNFWIRDEQTQNEVYYGFDENCRMITGWHDYVDYGTFYYGTDGKAYTGYQNVDGLNYLFEQWGQLVKYSRVENGIYYEIDETDYHIITRVNLNYGGWTQIGEDWYYYDELGNPNTEWKYIDGSYYYFDYNGRARHNESMTIYDEVTKEFHYYRFDTNCRMVTGWFKEGYVYYYYGTDGKAFRGYNVIDGVSYVFDTNGMMLTNDTVCDGYYYFINQDGVVQSWKKINLGEWTQLDGEWYYYDLQGNPYVGWHQINGSYYYFGYDGKAYRNIITPIYEGNPQDIYGFDKNCQMVTGWFKYQNYWYYFGSSGVALTGSQIINGSQYYFNTLYQSPSMVVDSIAVDTQLNKIYYCDENGYASEIQTVNGWNLIEGNWYYLDNGVLAKNQLKDVGGITYVFDEEGQLCRGPFVYLDGSQYIVDKNGQLVRGQWLLSENIEFPPIWLLSNADGTPYNGWYNNYYIDHGRMITGIKLIDNQYYLFGEDGILQSNQPLVEGWNFIQGHYYYFENGQLANGWKTINGQAYYFDIDNNIMQQGIKSIFSSNASEYYVFSSSGALMRNCWVYHPSTAYSDSYWTYSLDNGSLAFDQWIQLGNNWYYVDDYFMVTGNKIIDNVLYSFDSDGVMIKSESLSYKNGWIQNHNQWFYYRGGKKAQGWQQIDGQWYYFLENKYSDESGFMITGLFSVDNELYFFDENGHLLTNTWGYYPKTDSWYYTDYRGIVLTGWQYINGNTYYFDQFGCMVSDGIHRINRKEYRFADNGVYLGEYIPNSDGWKYVDGNWYFYENGIRKTWERIGDYCVDSKGKMITNGYPKEIDSLVLGKGSTGGFMGPYVYTDANGNILKNHWFIYKGSWYYTDSNGYIVRDKTIIIDGMYYTFNYDGSMLTF